MGVRHRRAWNEVLLAFRPGPARRPTGIQMFRWLDRAWWADGTERTATRRRRVIYRAVQVISAPSG